jgi:hypothetical protein
MALWIHSLSFYRGSTRTTTSWEPIVFKTRMPTSCRVYKNLLVEDWPILCGREQAFQEPPRTRQRIAGRQSSTVKNYFWGLWSATRGGVRLVTLKTPRASPWCKHKRQADGEPSLVVGRGHISWTMLSLMALTRQKQLAKSRQAASQPASQH